jgi:uncharacterized protein YecT (DUF1311 family)
MIRRFRSPAVVLAILALLVTVRSALAANPSFDCDKANAPAERLICGDSELVRLDALMGETYARRRAGLGDAERKSLLEQQRAWLKGRLAQCGIPAQGGEPEEKQIWAWAPCLADRYRERLSALGVADPAPKLPADAGFVHPLCMLRVVGSVVGEDEPAPTPLQACNNAYRHIPVDRDDPAGFSAARGGILPESVTYHLVGALADGGQVVTVDYWGGGTGQFSSVYKLVRNGDILTGSLITVGGDRCNGGVNDVKVVDGRTVRVSFNGSPYDLAAQVLADAEQASALPSCAICCTGTATREFSPGDKEGRLIELTVEHDRDIANDEKALLCLNRILGLSGGQSVTLGADKARAAFQRYVKECAK